MNASWIRSTCGGGLLAASLVLGTLSLPAAQAAPMFVQATEPTREWYRGDGPFVLGSLIRVGGTGLVVNALGYHYPVGGERPASGLVGIWTADGAQLLASGTVTPNDPADAGNWRYTNIAPLTLEPNTPYLLGAVVGQGIEWFMDSTLVNSPTPFAAASADLTIVENRVNWSSTLTPPTLNGSGPLGRWAPANAQYTLVPEPAALSLIGLAAAGLLARRRH